jgi:hypothetical protein
MLYVSMRRRPHNVLGVSLPAKKVSAPGDVDKKQFTRILQYLNGTTDYSLFFEPKTSQFRISAISDSDQIRKIFFKIYE